jgi:hypothetical protein
MNDLRAFYFPHDYNAVRDQKVIKLIRALGYEGYGLFWAIVERLYENGGRLSADFETIAFDLRADQGKVEAVINAFGLFKVADGMVGSDSVDRRMDERRARAEMARQRGLRSGAARASEQALKASSNGFELERKGKERKEITAAPSAAGIEGGGVNGNGGAVKELIEDLAASKFFSTQTDPLARRCAIRGPYHGLRFQDIPAEDAAFLLARAPRLGASQKEGLEARVALKESELIARRKS